MSEQAVVLQNIVVLGLDINCWSGRKKLRREDLPAAAENLPPNDLASLGSKRICDPEHLKVFERLRKRAHRESEEIGTRFMGGYAIPTTRLAELSRLLESFKTEFMAAKASFLANYGTEIDTWVGAHPGWESIIRSAITPKETVERGLNFRWMAFKVNPVEDEALSSCDFQSEIKGLADTLFDEIAQSADEAWENSFLGKDSVRRSALSPIKTMVKKLDGLSFIDTRVTPIVQTINATLAKMPDPGPICGSDLTELHGLIFMLSSPDRMKAHGQALLDGTLQGVSVQQEEQVSLDFDSVTPEPMSQNLFDLPLEPSMVVDSQGAGVVTQIPAEVEQPPSLFQQDGDGEVAVPPVMVKVHRPESPPVPQVPSGVTVGPRVVRVVRRPLLDSGRTPLI